MDIQEYLDIARQKPDSLQIIGKGGRCLALVAGTAPHEVLLLENSKQSHDGQARIDPAHDRAVTFARQYDAHIAAGMKDVVNNTGRPYVHSELVAEVSPRKFGEPLYLHVGKGEIFIGTSARLVKRIPGKPLHYLDFVDKKSSIQGHQDALAKDIANWLFQLHHPVSTGAMVANKIEKQFTDRGHSLTSRVLNSTKHRVFVTSNAREVQSLEARLSQPWQEMSSDERDYIAKLRANISDAGVNFALMARTAKPLEAFLREVLPTDRIGLTHSDLHPANILVSKDSQSVTGVCDWMTGSIDAQSIDFAGLGLARGLLPRVVREYQNLERRHKVAKPIDPQAIYAYAAMRQIFITTKSLIHRFDDGAQARVAWQQVGESVEQLGRMNPQFRHLARRFRHQAPLPIRLPASRTSLGAHPHKVDSYES